MKYQTLAAEYLLYESLWRLDYSKFRHSSKWNHFFLIVKTSHYMFAEFSVRPHRTKHENKSSIAEISSDIRVWCKHFLLIAKNKRYSRQCIMFSTSTLLYIFNVFLKLEMLVYCNTKQFLSSSFFKSDFMIGIYLIPIGFSNAHKVIFTRIKDHIIVIEPLL